VDSTIAGYQEWQALQAAHKNTPLNSWTTLATEKSAPGSTRSRASIFRLPFPVFCDLKRTFDLIL
jgi:hypothetical protein